MDIQNRVVSYYKNNSFIQKFLKGIDPKTNEVVLDYNGAERRVLIDTLENIKSEEELNSFMQGKPIATPEVAPVEIPSINPEPVVTPEVPATPSVEQAPVVESAPIAEPQVVVQSNIVADQPIANTETLDDIKILVELKNKEGLDNVLKKFAVNPSTGLIDINTAISVVTKNTMNEVVNAIKSGMEFDLDTTHYDVQGNYTGTANPATTSEDEMIAKSFNNVKIYIDASKMYPDQVNYNDEQIATFMQT